MRPKQQKLTFLLTVSLTAFLLSSCGSAASPKPTEINIDAIYTAAAQTMAAQLSSTANANPTATIAPSATITPTPTAGTSTLTPTKTLTKYIAPPVQPTATTSGTPGPTSTATFGAVGCNNSGFVSDVTIPDGTTTQAGASFTKTWSIKNTGTCPWTFNFKFTFVGGELMNSDTFKIRRTVAPGASTQISVLLTAPTRPGTHTGYWRMADDKGVLFGVSFSVSIKVPGATYTPVTPMTVTKTPTAVTGTPSPTTAASTPTPTATTAIIIPVATDTPTTPPTTTAPTETPTLPSPTATDMPTATNTP